jgi:hypothetical protein
MKSAYMLRRLIVIFMALTLSVTSVACGGNNERSNQGQTQPTTTTAQSPALTNNTTQTAIPAGKYPVQQATYNDANGEYSLMLLNTPAGVSSAYRTTNLQMARLTDEEVTAKEAAYLKSENGQTSLHIPQDFKIEYVHNVTQAQTNPQTGQRETVVVRRESNFWAPFAGAVAGQIAGQAISNALFRPQYYVPPVYSSGGGLFGYGGYGRTYGQAVTVYQNNYNAPPPAVVNRTTLRTTGRLNNSNFGTTTRTNTNRTVERNRSTGSGFGSSTLRQSGRSGSTVRQYTPSNRSFGSGGRSRSSSGFGSRRR